MSLPVSRSEHIGIWRPMVVHMPCLRKWSTKQRRSQVHKNLRIQKSPQRSIHQIQARQNIRHARKKSPSPNTQLCRRGKFYCRVCVHLRTQRWCVSRTHFRFDTKPCMLEERTSLWTGFLATLVQDLMFEDQESSAGNVRKSSSSTHQSSFTS